MNKPAGEFTSLRVRYPAGSLRSPAGLPRPCFSGVRTVKKLLLALLLIGIGLAGLVYWLKAPRRLAVSDKIFTYATVQRGLLTETISATGLVEPREVILVFSELPGVVTEVLAKANDVVAEGAVLARLDERKVLLKLEEATHGVCLARAALDQAKAMGSAAEIGLRYQKDIENRGGFRSELEQAEAQLKTTRAGVEAAQARLQAAATALREAQLAQELTAIKVPLRPTPPPSPLVRGGQEGRSASTGSKRRYLILERKVQIGQLVGPQGNGPLFTLASDLENLEVHAQVAEGDIGRVSKGLTATFTVSADVDIEFSGLVREIRPMPTTVKGAVFYDTVLEVANKKDAQTGEWRLRPGMTAAIDLIRRQHKNVWKMPTAALNFQLEEPYQSDEAQQRLAEWQQRADHVDWKPVWTWDEDRGCAWPVFVRIGGLKNGQPGIKDSEFNEVLEWEPGREPDAKGPPLPVITGAPPARSRGFFEQPANIKVS